MHSAQFPGPGDREGRISISRVLTSDDVVRELQKLERTSRYGVDAFTLAEAGMEVSTSEQGRDLRVATVGSGAEHVWLQGRIHGNEPCGTDFLLSLLEDLGTNGSAEYELLREKFTFHVIPMCNPDGAEAHIRHTVLWGRVSGGPEGGAPQRIDLDRDWTAEGFATGESRAFCEYWTTVSPPPAYSLRELAARTGHRLPGRLCRRRPDRLSPIAGRAGTRKSGTPVGCPALSPVRCARGELNPHALSGTRT